MTGSAEVVVGASVVAAAPVVPAGVEAVSVLAVVSDDDFESLPHAPSTASAARPSAARGMPRPPAAKEGVQ